MLPDTDYAAQDHDYTDDDDYADDGAGDDDNADAHDPSNAPPRMLVPNDADDALDADGAHADDDGDDDDDAPRMLLFCCSSQAIWLNRAPLVVPLALLWF